MKYQVVILQSAEQDLNEPVRAFYKSDQTVGILDLIPCFYVSKALLGVSNISYNPSSHQFQALIATFDVRWTEVCNSFLCHTEYVCMISDRWS